MELFLCHAFQLTVWASGSAHMAQLCMNACTYILQIHQLSLCDPSHCNSSLRNENAATIYSLSHWWKISSPPNICGASRWNSVAAFCWTAEVERRLLKSIKPWWDHLSKFLYFIFHPWKGKKKEKKKKGCLNQNVKKKMFGRNETFFQRTSELSQLLILMYETKELKRVFQNNAHFVFAGWGLEFETWTRVTLESQPLWLEARLGLKIWDSCTILIISLLWCINIRWKSFQLLSVWTDHLLRIHRRKHTWTGEG